MATLTRRLLSGETNAGESSVSIVANATAGTTIHTAVAGSSDIDEVWLWASNVHTAAVVLKMEWGNTTAGRLVKVTIQPAETILISPGWVANGGNVLAAFCATTAVVNVHGYVNRITA